MNQLDVLMPRSDLPEGQSGEWSIERFTISPANAARYNGGLIWDGQDDRQVEPGEYTHLMQEGNLDTWMSDTHAERIDHLEMVQKAHGHVLINGLGLGVCVNACLLKPSVDHVTVIELQQDVINLVEPHLKKKFGDRLTVVCANALEYESPKGSRYGVVWHDIWLHLSSDNWNDMEKLRLKYLRKADWQDSWGREYAYEEMMSIAEAEEFWASLPGGDMTNPQLDPNIFTMTN